MMGMVNTKLSKKIKKGRTWFQKQKIKKSGKNNFHNYTYYELRDISPYHDEMCNQLNIDADLNMKHEGGWASLDVVDLDQDDKQEIKQFWTRVPILSGGNPTQEMQQEGGIETYAKRYLFIQLWNINESDPIEASKIGINTTPEELVENASVPKERANEIAGLVGQNVSHNGGDARDKNALTEELNKLLKSKKITNDEFVTVKKMINDLK